MTEQLLPATPPFDPRRSIRALGSFTPCVGEQELTGTRIRKAFAVTDERAAVATVTPADGGVRLAVHGAAGPADDAVVAGAVTQWLGLDDDLAPFLALAADDPPVAELLGVLRGLHQVRFAGLAEATTYFVLTHRTQQSVAAARKRRLAATYGPVLDHDGQERRAFPTLGRLAGLAPAELAPFTGRDQQTEYLHAALVGVHDLGEEFLRGAPYDEAYRALRQIRGIGDFTASAILLRGLGRPDRVPLEMAQFGGAITRLYGPGADAGTVRARYGRYQGWWSYLVRTAIGWQDGE